MSPKPISGSYLNYSVLKQAPMQSPFREDPVPEEEARLKMQINAVKAFERHVEEESRQFNQCPKNSTQTFESTYDYPNETRNSQSSGIPLKFSCNGAELQGNRLYMEDAHFVLPLTKGRLLLSVLDGHGGDTVANLAKQKFQEIFPCVLQQNENHIHQALEITTAITQRELLKNPASFNQGCAAVFCMLDSLNEEVITATIGDCEANIYRKQNDRTISIPLSYVKNWESESEKKRALSFYSAQNFVTWHDNYKRVRGWNVPTERPANRYLLCKDAGINVSRAFGDARFLSAVSVKPKITVHAIEKGDTITLTSDGGKEVSEKKLAQKIHTSGFNDLSKTLADFAYKEGSQDNITFIAVKVD